MRLKKKIEELEKKLDLLIGDTKQKAKKYDEQKELLSNVKFSVNKMSFFVDKTGLVGLNIEYTIPKIQIFFNDENEVVKNETFFAINKLNLISIEDMQKISEKLEEIRRKNEFR